MVFAILSKKYLYQREIFVLLYENAQRQRKRLFCNLKDNFYGQISLSIFFVCYFLDILIYKKIKLKYMILKYPEFNMFFRYKNMDIKIMNNL